jgi:hypothetical protein
MAAVDCTGTYTMAIRKVTSGELLAKQAIRQILYTKNAYILTLLLNIVTTGIETLV